MVLEFSSRFRQCIHNLITKNWHAPDSLFSKFDVRKHFSFEESLEKFGAVWKGGLENAVIQAPTCSYETAREQINEYERAYLRQDCEYRTVRYRGLLFVVQIIQHTNRVDQIDQLWFIPSYDKENIILCVEFESPEERDEFHEIARNMGLGYQNGKDLLQKYVDDLLGKHSAS